MSMCVILIGESGKNRERISLCDYTGCSMTLDHNLRIRILASFRVSGGCIRMGPIHSPLNPNTRGTLLLEATSGGINIQFGQRMTGDIYDKFLFLVGWGK
jgi:hypothetical protein